LEIKIAHRASGIKPSPTLSVTAKAAALRAEGKDIISLSAGEPDFDTPEFIKEAAIQALHDGFTKYTPVGGTAGLKQAIVDKFSKENNLEYTSDQILVSCGAKHSLYNLCQALINPGDEVIIPAPYWVSYPDMVRLAEGEPVILAAGIENGFKINPDQLRASITDKSRLFIINSPSNPTGVAYTPEELQQLGEILREYPQLLIATDDIYEHILWGQDKFQNIVNVCPYLYERTIVVNGMSKAYSMTGWRIGYVGGPADLVKAMQKIQSQSTSNPTGIAQVASQEALQGDQSFILKNRDIFKARHDYVYKRLNAMSGITASASDGTFYSFPDANEALKNMVNIKNDIEFAEYLLEHAGIAVVPGSAFGAPGYMRISYATSMENLELAMDRLQAVVG
jgi:aspartate aminotransferase